MKIIIIAPLSAIALRTRLSKIASILVERDFEVFFIGWERSSGELNKYATKGVTEWPLLRGGGYSSRRARALYPVWMLLVFFWVLVRGRNKTLYCLGWETAFPAKVASYLSGSKVVFDDADRFSMLVQFPLKIGAVVRMLERWTSRSSFLHIVPSFSRYEWRFDNMIEIKNTPLRGKWSVSEGQAGSKPSRPLILYVNGWVGQTRGAPIFLELMSRLNARGVGVLMHVAGRVDCPSGRQLIALPNVKYHGLLTQDEALELYGESDLVLTYYDPAVEINRLAESNKWGDCVFTGVPFVVNSEVLTARKFLDAGAAFAFPYVDHAALLRFIEEQVEDRSRIVQARKSIFLLKDQAFDFESQFGTVIARVTQGMGKR
ncbi:hypothetical protein ASALC70_04084 [Alcanivorax sp. ALC70]|nr:hypothetical protein ASALC70_04084 [Alcanivorax sp. ALC70]